MERFSKYPLMASVSGVRGIIGKSLTPEVIVRYAGAFGTLCGGGQIVVGRDTRVSGEMVEYAVYAGLMAAGCTVIPIGVSTTPTVQLAVEKMKASGGIVITASHNPEYWNGLKFINSRGIFLDEKAGNKLSNIIANELYHYSDYSGIGKLFAPVDFTGEHIQAIVNAELVDVEVIRRCRFKVVVDCVNGAGSVIFPELLDTLGCQVTVIHGEPDGKFPRGPEPVPENIKTLCKTVVNNHSDIGFACDPDADRLSIVDNTGAPIGEEYSIVLSALLVLSHKKGAVGVNLSTTSVVDNIAQRFGVPVYRSKVGEAHVVKMMMETGCVIGGEGNGGVILPEIHYGRDALVGAALTLQLMAERQESLTEIIKDIPHYYMTKHKVEVSTHKAKTIIKKIAAQISGCTVDTTDGLKIIYPDSWVHIRLSNTEPIVRVITEAASKELSEKLASQYLQYFIPIGVR